MYLKRLFLFFFLPLMQKLESSLHFLLEYRQFSFDTFSDVTRHFYPIHILTLRIDRKTKCILIEHLID